MAAASFDQCRFAECLEKYEAIWNDKSKEHADKAKRKSQMKAMADELGISRRYLCDVRVSIVIKYIYSCSDRRLPLAKYNNHRRVFCMAPLQ